MAGMTPTTTSEFPKMGDDGMAGVVNMSGQRSPYTQERPRSGPTTPDMGGSPAGGRSSTMIHEAHGPTFRPVASKVQGSEYPDTGRGMRTVASSVGNRDFWASRAGSNEGEIIG